MSDEPQGLWVSVAELGRMKGISKQAVAKKCDRLEAQGHLTTRPGPRGVRLVNIAAYDKAVGEVTDAVRALNGTPAARDTDPVLAREQARRASYAADLAQLDLEERLGKLIPVTDVRSAMTTCAETLVRLIDQLPGRADEIASAVGKGGAVAARDAMKGFARDLRAALARAMTLQAGDSVETSEEDA